MARSSSRRRRPKSIKRRVPPGSSPGTLVADPSAPKPVLSAIAYGPDGLVEATLASVAELRALRGRHPVLWLNVDGLGDAELVLAIGECFGLHRLSLEDVLHVHQRAKVERYGEVQFLVARMVEWNGGLETEQLSVFLGPDFVVTFQERAGDAFDPIRARLRDGRGTLRLSGPDYLVYALLDAVIDGYFPLLETFGERLEALEDEILATPTPDDLAAVYGVKHDLLTLRRAIWPLRDALNALLRDADPMIRGETRLYLNDCLDHTVQVVDLVETYREVASNLTEIYLTNVSYRLNEVMKVLTIIATIFIPLTFVVGVYGMNFDPDSSPWNMPELRARYGYPVCLAAMLAVALGLLVWFRRRGWLGTSAVSRVVIPAAQAGAQAAVARDEERAGRVP